MSDTFNGVDLAALEPDLCVAFPSVVEGRVLQLDGDAACYKVTYNPDEHLRTCIDNFWSMIDYRRQMAGCEYINIHLTGHNKGGRSEIATVKKYQGNRDGKVKPQNLIDLREYLVSLPPAPQRIVYHEDQEADDGMCQENHTAILAGNRNLSIIMSEDKDLTMCQGLRCDWNTFEIIDVNGYGKIWLDETGSTTKLKGYGSAFFWAQLLMGDSADNIPGCELIGAEILEKYDPLIKPNPKRKPKKCGAVLAYNILKDVTSDMQALLLVIECYRSYYGNDYKYTAWNGLEIQRQSIEMLYEQAQLLWMRRVQNESPRAFFKEIMGV